MAVVLESWGVVARRAAVEATLQRGLRGWFEAAPNHMACADRDLCVVSFMVLRDASAFLVKLESLGLQSEREGAYRDVAVVGQSGPWQHACTWLEHGRYAGVQAVWLRGSDPEPIVVPLVWRPDPVIHVSDEEAARRFKFLRREGAIEVFLDTDTGTEVFRGRTSAPDTLEPELESRLKAAVTAIEPLLAWDGRPARLGWFKRRRLARGIRELEAIASGDRWRVWWFLGLARRAAGDPAGAFEAFEHAYAANPAHPDVSREFGGQCLAVGRGELAVAVCERNCTLHPADAGLRANLALACLVANDLPRARAEVARALEMDSVDAITRALKQMIDDVVAGKRPRPTKYP